MSGPLRIEIADAVATVTFERPERRNALSYGLLDALHAALNQAARANVRVLVLTGSGGCFSAGADIAELKGTADDLAFDDRLGEIVADLRRFPFLAIAAIEGPCIGAALDLACACDVRVAAATAMFELPALRLGLLYNPAAIARMHRSLPSATLRRVLLCGERIGGDIAVAAGIATHAAEAAKALEIATGIARRAAATWPRALAETKRLINALDDGGADPVDWQAVRLEILASPDRKAALAAAKSRFAS